MLTNSEPGLQNWVQSDLILPKGFYSHSREGQQATGDLSNKIMHCSLGKQKNKQGKKQGDIYLSVLFKFFNHVYTILANKRRKVTETLTGFFVPSFMEFKRSPSFRQEQYSQLSGITLKDDNWGWNSSLISNKPTHKHLSVHVSSLTASSYRRL